MRQQGVAVGLGVGGHLRTHLSGRARLGVDHDRLLHHGLENRGERTHDDIDRAVWWILGREDVFLNTVGDLELLPRVLDSASRYEARPTPEEIDDFLHGVHTMNCATHGPDGDIHLVAMWYGFLGKAPAFWTFGKSQKIKNLERDPRITCLVEAGDEYAQLRGVELVGRGTVITDTDDIIAIGLSTSQRHTGADPEASRPFVEAQAGKRIGVRIDVEKVVSWDHRKLEGRY